MTEIEQINDKLNKGKAISDAEVMYAYDFYTKLMTALHEAGKEYGCVMMGTVSRMTTFQNFYMNRGLDKTIA